MFLDDQQIPAFLTYLHVDLKISRDSNSVSAIRSRLRKLFRWFEGKEYTRANVRAFIGYLLESETKPSYLNKFIVLCKQLDKYLGVNTMQGFTYFHETYQVKETLTPTEIRMISEVMLSYKWDSEYINARQRCLIMLLGTTGCRIGEALKLKWGDIASEPPNIILRETKNGDVRVVPIGREVYDLIHSLPHKGEYVFTSYRGGVLDHQEFNLDLKKRAAAAGITKNVYAHIFRHSYITTMLESGVDSLDVAHIVGHRDPKSTMRYKNSLLTYYSGVAQLHPMLRSSLSIEQISKSVHSHVLKIVDSVNYDLSFEQSSDGVKVLIRRRANIS